MNILITICARGGSKGVQNKNIKKLDGKPLIVYTIEVAKKWGKAKRIVCSTDSKNIALIAKKTGADAPFLRPKKLSADTAGKIAAIRHALLKCEEIYNEKYGLIMDLDVTSPVRTEKDLENCLKIFVDKKPQVVASVFKARKNPYFNMIECDNQGYAKLVKKSKSPILSRQSAPKVYDMNASIYLYSRSFLLNKKNNSVFCAKKLIPYEMSESSSLDVDTELDFQYMEFLINKGILSFK